MTDSNRKRADALAQLSGRINALYENGEDEVSVEYLVESFNQTIEDCDIESDVLPIEK